MILRLNYLQTVVFIKIDSFSLILWGWSLSWQWPLPNCRITSPLDPKRKYSAHSLEVYFWLIFYKDNRSLFKSLQPKSDDVDVSSTILWRCVSTWFLHADILNLVKISGEITDLELLCSSNSQKSESNVTEPKDKFRWW